MGLEVILDLRSALPTVSADTGMLQDAKRHLEVSGRNI